MYNHEEYIKRNKPIKKEVVYSDFRLPTIQELLTLVDYSKRNPASTFGIASRSYWSSTISVSSTLSAWYVDFYFGYTSYNKVIARNMYVCCVRDSEHGLQWSDDAPGTMDWYEAIEYAKNLVAPARGITYDD